MMKPFRIILTLLVLLCLTGCALPGGGEEETTEEVTEETVPETTVDPRIEVKDLTMVVTDADILQLEDYPNLRSADLSGSECYTAIIVYAQNHPEVDVTYTVDFGGAVVDNWTTEVTLENWGVDVELLNRNLIYLPQLQSVHLAKTNLSREEIEAVRMVYPELAITYTVEVQGQEYGEDTEEVNLSGLTEEQVSGAIPALLKLPNLHYVELMDENGDCALSKQDVRTLVEAAPAVRFHYNFTLFGRPVSTTDEKIEFKELDLSENDEETIRDALSIMAEGSVLILDRCGLDYDFLAGIREDYDNAELAWRVYFGTDNRYTALTCGDTIRAVYNVTDSTCYNLRYCRGCKYMDLGHNDTLTDLSFIGYMTNLEILIASGCAVSDLSGFENCKKLEFLELANCGKLSDLTPLSGCDGLKNLNVCYTKVSDLQPLDGLPLEQLFCKQTRVPASEQKVFKEIHEGCIATFYGKEAYAGPGWRYTDSGKTYTEIYKKVREVFNYDAADALIRASDGALK